MREFFDLPASAGRGAESLHAPDVSVLRSAPAAPHLRRSLAAAERNAVAGGRGRRLFELPRQIRLPCDKADMRGIRKKSQTNNGFGGTRRNSRTSSLSSASEIEPQAHPLAMEKKGLAVPVMHPGVMRVGADTSDVGEQIDDGVPLAPLDRSRCCSAAARRPGRCPPSGPCHQRRENYFQADSRQGARRPCKSVGGPARSIRTPCRHCGCRRPGSVNPSTSRKPAADRPTKTNTSRRTSPEVFFCDGDGASPPECWCVCFPQRGTKCMPNIAV